MAITKPILIANILNCRLYNISDICLLSKWKNITKLQNFSHFLLFFVTYVIQLWLCINYVDWNIEFTFVWYWSYSQQLKWVKINLKILCGFILFKFLGLRTKLLIQLSIAELENNILFTIFLQKSKENEKVLVVREVLAKHFVNNIGNA